MSGSGLGRNPFLSYSFWEKPDLTVHFSSYSFSLWEKLGMRALKNCHLGQYTAIILSRASILPFILISALMKNSNDNDIRIFY